MKFRAKLSIFVSILTTVASVTVGSVAYAVMYRSADTQASASVGQTADLVSVSLKDSFSAYITNAVAASSDPVINSSPSDDLRSARVDQLAATYGFSSGNVLNYKGVSIKDGTDYSEREYVKQALKGVPNISEVSLSKLTGKYGVSIAAPIVNSGNGSITGVIYFRIDVDFIVNMLDIAKASDNSVAYVIDAAGNIVAHPDQSFIYDDKQSMTSRGLSNIIDDCAADTSGVTSLKKDDGNYFLAYSPIANGWSIVIEAPADDFRQNINQAGNMFLVIDLIVIAISICLAAGLARALTRKLENTLTSITALKQGDFNHVIEEDKGLDEFAQLQNSMADLQSSLKSLIGDANQVLAGMADFNLVQPDLNEYPGDYNTLAVSINRIKDILRRLIAEVQSTVSGVNAGSSEIANAADLLSSGTVEQAGAVQDMVDQVNDVTAIIDASLDASIAVNDRFRQLADDIDAGNKEMTELSRIVTEIESMSEDIKSVVSTIDGIAFQTNILALNASVEAARAGSSGKGFAVVANEVRSLAGKAAESSKQTAELINSCIVNIEKALKSAEATSGTLGNIVVSSNEIAGAFEKITEDSRVQASKAASMRTAIDSISDVVQTNTATAEETAAASEELNSQAAALGRLISKFTV